MDVSPDTKRAQILEKQRASIELIDHLMTARRAMVDAGNLVPFIYSVTGGGTIEGHLYNASKSVSGAINRALEDHVQLIHEALQSYKQQLADIEADNPVD